MTWVYVSRTTIYSIIKKMVVVHDQLTMIIINNDESEATRGLMVQSLGSSWLYVSLEKDTSLYCTWEAGYLAIHGKRSCLCE